MAAAFSHHHHNQQQLITSPADHLDLLTSPLSDTFSDHHHFQYQYSAGLVDTNLIFNDPPPFGCFQDLIDPTSNNSTGDACVVQDTLSCIIDQATTPPSAPPDDSLHPPNTSTDDDHFSNSLTVKQISHGCSHQKGLKRNPSRPSANSVNTKNVRGGKKQRKRNYSKLSGIKVGGDDDKKEMKINNCLPPPIASCREIAPGYIHVRARRGQATDSHSLAERVRREKISERMKVLQALVPGCDKVTGKAMMLDEIINYVQSLQTQVEFLSMKLVSLSPMVYSYSNGDIGMDQDSVPSTMINLQDQYLPMLEQCNSSPPSVVYKSPSLFLNQQEQNNNNNKDVWCSMIMS